MSIIENVPIYDLRTIKTADEARVISELREVPVVIMPESREPSLMRALRDIDIREAAYILSLDDKTVVKSINGICELTHNNFHDRKSSYIINGVCFLHGLDGTESGDIIVNGMLIIAENDRDKMKLNIPFVNGKTEYVDAERVLSFENNLYITLEFLKYIKPKALIIAGNKIEISPDVNIEDLEQKGVTLLATNKIGCKKAMMPYIQARAIYGNKVYEI